MNQDQFQDIESELNQIAMNDRGATSSDFESRLLQRVMHDVHRATAQSVIVRVKPSIMRQAPVRLAAAIAILGAIGAAFLANEARNANKNAESVATMMSDMEMMLAIAAELDDGSSDELAMLHSETKMLGEKVRGGIADLIDEGAM
ncbi:MAG: hypothetical protein ACK54H_11600 [Phycisphaerales bacterium]|jgi:hypothetical protein